MADYGLLGDFYNSGTMPSLLRQPTTPCKIGNTLTIDVLKEHEVTFESEVSENPVETGFVIADHVTRKPLTLRLTAIFTPTPVTFADMSINSVFDFNPFSNRGNIEVNRLSNVANALMQIYQKGEPVTVMLHDSIYTDMVMLSAPLKRTLEDGICYVMELNFKHVIIVEQRTEEVSENNASGDAKGKAGATEKDGGTAEQKDIGTGMTTIANNSTVNIWSLQADLSANGIINTGKEITASIAANAIEASLQMSPTELQGISDSIHL